MADALVILYQKAAEVTRKLCDQHCQNRGPNHCCQAKYCEDTREFARKHYGVELQDTGHEIPFMGPAGCTVAPHLRPACSLHICPIQWGKGLGPEIDAAYLKMHCEVMKEARAQGKVPEFSV